MDSEFRKAEEKRDRRVAGEGRGGREDSDPDTKGGQKKRCLESWRGKKSIETEVSEHEVWKRGISEGGTH